MDNVKSGKEPVATFNYWLKNLSPMMIYEHRMNSQNEVEFKIRLRDCEINQPTTDKGIKLLDYCMATLKKIYYGN